MQEVKVGLLQALKPSRLLTVTTVIEIKLYFNVPGHVSEQKKKKRGITYTYRYRGKGKEQSKD